MHLKMTRIKALLLSISFFLILPTTAQAIPVLYEVGGTGTDNFTNEIRSLTGFVVIDDEPSFDPTEPVGQSGLTYSIESSIFILEGIGFAFGPSALRFEYDFSVGWFQQNDDALFSEFLDDGNADDVLFEYSDGTAYDPFDYFEWTELAPVIKITGDSYFFGDFDYNGYLDFTLTAVPEPSVIAIFGLGLLGLGFTKRKNAA